MSNYDVIELVVDDSMTHAVLRSRTEYGICPYCGMPSSVHYGFTKKEVHCLPSGSGSVSLTLLQHRYLCANEACDHTTFTEENNDVDQGYTIWKLMLQHHLWRSVRLNTAIDNLFNYKPKSYYYSSPLTTGISFSVGLSIDLESVRF